jgi:hypothetical protein
MDKAPAIFLKKMFRMSTTHVGTLLNVQHQFTKQATEQKRSNEWAYGLCAKQKREADWWRKLVGAVLNVIWSLYNTARCGADAASCPSRAGLSPWAEQEDGPAKEGLRQQAWSRIGHSRERWGKEDIEPT